MVCVALVMKRAPITCGHQQFPDSYTTNELLTLNACYETKLQ